VRRLRDRRFTQQREPTNSPSEQNEIPAFLSSAPDGEQQRTFTRSPRWRNWIEVSSRLLSRLTAWRPTKNELAIYARAALAFVLLPLAVASSPIVSRAPGNDRDFSIAESRMSFGQGLGRRLASEPAIDLSADTSARSDLKPEQPVPSADDPEKPLAASETAQPDHRSVTALITDNRRWSLPFGSQEYAPADLPANPATAFKTEIDQSRFPDDIEILTAHNDVPVLRDPSRVKRPATPRDRVLGYSRRAPKVTRTREPAVKTVVVEPPEPGLLPPILFFLGAPPSEEPPPMPKSPRPTRRSPVPNSFRDIFTYED